MTGGGGIFELVLELTVENGWTGGGGIGAAAESVPFVAVFSPVNPPK